MAASVLEGQRRLGEGVVREAVPRRRGCALGGDRRACASDSASLLACFLLTKLVCYLGIVIDRTKEGGYPPVAGSSNNIS